MTMIKLDDSNANQIAARYKVPALPNNVEVLHQLINSPSLDVEKISKHITQNMGLSSYILTNINSTCSYTRQPFDNVMNIANVLGLNALTSITTALALRRAFGQFNHHFVEKYWTYAIETANAMAFLGNETKTDIRFGLLFTIGMFHDCGMPLMAVYDNDYPSILERSRLQCDNSIKLEEQHFGINHAALSYLVAKTWHIPANICQLILRHHDFTYLDDARDSKDQLALCLLKAAEYIISHINQKKPSPDWPEFKRVVLLMLGISEDHFHDIVGLYQSAKNKTKE